MVSLSFSRDSFQSASLPFRTPHTNNQAVGLANIISSRTMMMSISYIDNFYGINYSNHPRYNSNIFIIAIWRSSISTPSRRPSLNHPSQSTIPNVGTGDTTTSGRAIVRPAYWKTKSTAGIVVPPIVCRYYNMANHVVCTASVRNSQRINLTERLHYGTFCSPASRLDH